MRFYIIYFIILLFGINYLDVLSEDNSILIAKQFVDTLKINNTEGLLDTNQNQSKRKVVMQRVNDSGLDTIVTYKAKDSIVFSAKNKQMKLNNEANINFKGQIIDAYQIIISFDESKLSAISKIDSNNKFYGIPKFSDKGEDFYGQNIDFNFKTGKGVISLGETEVSQQFFFGEKIKKINEQEYNICNGYFTTCDNPEPHFHFGSSKMKVINKDRIFLDPLVFYIEDLPIMIIPFGLFFPSSSGRQSGLMIPTFSFSKSRGVVFQNFGYYWAASDYWDTQLKTDIYTKGGIMLKTTTRWTERYNFNGSMDLDYGKTRNNVDQDYSTNWKLVLNHTQDFTPYDKLVVNLNFYSENFNRNTQTTNADYITQSVRSSASYSKQFNNGTTLGIGYEREQNIISDEYTQSSSARYNIPSKKIFSSFTNMPKWIRDITLNYSVNARYKNSKQLITSYQQNLNDSSKIDTIKSYRYNHSQRIDHNPSINISPKLGNFIFRPYINFNATNFFRSVNRKFNNSDSTITADTTWGLYTDYTYGAGLNISTYLYGIFDDNKKLFGLIKASDLGIKAFRHVYNPTLGWSIRPNQSSINSLFGEYFNQSTQQKVIYSRFDLDGGGISSRQFSSSLNYSDIHSFEIKIAQGDTLPDKNLELLKINLNSSYDFAKDSLNLNDLNVQFRSPALKFIDFNGSTTFKFYDEIRISEYDSIRNVYSDRYVTTNNLLLSQGKGLFRMSNLSLSIGTTFNSSGVQTTDESPQDTMQTAIDSASYGERFSQRNFTNRPYHDIYGDNTPGYTNFNFPWSLNLSLYYMYGRPSIDPKTKNETIDLRLSGTLKLTNTWNLSFSGGYDFIRHTLTVPSINLHKDLHCWEFIFNWIPTGGNAGFYLRLGLKAPQLRDLKIEKQSNPLLR
ncbi:MAG TPA: putative LPS assembly protein LptD [Candidatus Kapabacteria bacterium]|nr:putative LPS assembly protein LptD [Candidatus Kapabacteria bacterium]